VARRLSRQHLAFAIDESDPDAIIQRLTLPPRLPNST
jgi:hypothetical protein